MYRVFQPVTGFLIDDRENFLNGFALGFVLQPAGEPFGHLVHLFHQAGRVRGNDCVADTVEGGPELFLGLPQLLFVVT